MTFEPGSYWVVCKVMVTGPNERAMATWFVDFTEPGQRGDKRQTFGPVVVLDICGRWATVGGIKDAQPYKTIEEAIGVALQIEGSVVDVGELDKQGQSAVWLTIARPFAKQHG